MKCLSSFSAGDNYVFTYTRQIWCVWCVYDSTINHGKYMKCTHITPFMPD